MPFDAIFLSAVVAELAPAVENSRIDKVQMPSRDTVLLSLRSRDGNRKLLLSSSVNHPRIHFTAEKYEQPAQPPMFCMLLRKHLGNAKILSLKQIPDERAAVLTVESPDELGVFSEKTLILELMGRNSNLILCGADGRIIDCVSRVDAGMSEKRQVLPGLFYRNPPRQDKLSVSAAEAEPLKDALRRVCESGVSCRLDRFLTDRFAGVSPLVARELSFRATGETECDILSQDPVLLGETLSGMLLRLGENPVPVLLCEGGAPKEFTYLPVAQYGDYYAQSQCAAFSELLDGFYAVRDRAERLQSKSRALHKTVSNFLARVTRKLENQRRELENACDRETLRRLGDIVTANLYRMERGQTRLVAENFYDPEMKEITVDLNPALSPQQNAARFYKEYNKAKNAEKMLTEQIAAGEREQDYLESVLEEMSRAETERDIADIRQELLDGGYLKNTEKQRRMKTAASSPMRFESSDGFAVLVGRNNRQNDMLTLKTARKSDLWLHAKNIHGSHVIVCAAGAEVPDRTVTEAAMLAAYYSRARQGQNVPVDCCPAGHVKKPAGAAFGKVVYENYSTVYVTPDATLPEKLSAGKEAE